MTYRTGNHWGVTIVREEPIDGMTAVDAQLVAVVVNGDQALAERIAWLLTHACPTCMGPQRETVDMVCQTCGTDYAAGSRSAPVDSCTCGVAGPDPACPVHHGRRARGPKPPPVGPGCNCDGSGRTCPRHGAVI
jgi:hypothetical protein